MDLLGGGNFISPRHHQIWAPPTPPQDENDLYIDYSVGFLYEPSVMSESSLPAVYIKKEAKRLKVDPLCTVTAARKQKNRKEDAVHIPKSLFDRPTAAILKMRREAKLQKVKNLMVCGAAAAGVPLPPKGLAGLAPTVRPPMAQQGGFLAARPLLDLSPDTPEWLIHEDWAILQVIQQMQDIPLNLTVLSPGHTPNWDLVSDAVNTVSRIYRSPKQCKDRYEAVIVPREEGKILYDTNPKKQKKTKGIYKTKNNKPMRTGQLFSQDCNQAFSLLYGTRFDTIRGVASKRTPTLKPHFTNPTAKNPKHAAVLAENGICYDQPLNPVRLAALRAERIAREKQKNQVAAAGVTTVALAKSGGILVSTAVTATTAAAATAGAVVSAAPTFALTKVPVTAVATLSPATLRPQRPQSAVVTAATTMTVQEMVAVATGQGAVVKAGAALAAGVTKQTAITRSLTEAEMAQLLKRREIQQKQAAVTIPVSAVTMAGVNINVSLAQGKVNTAKPTTTASVTSQQMQLRQLQIQQHLMQQQQHRKVTLQAQHKVAGLTQGPILIVTFREEQCCRAEGWAAAELALSPVGCLVQGQQQQGQQQQQGGSQQQQQQVAGKVSAAAPPTVATQLGTVQIVQQGGTKATALPSAITVQQIIKQVLPVNQNFLVSGAVQTAAGTSSGATTVSPATQVQLHAMLHKPAMSTVALAAPAGGGPSSSSGGPTTQATLVPTRIMTLQQPPGAGGQTVATLKQGLQVITASGAAQASSYTVEGSATTGPLVASIVTDAAALKPGEGGALPKATIAVAVTTATGDAAIVVPPNVTAPSSSSETITRAVSVDVSAATVQAVQAAIEAARQQGSLPYTMRLRNNPPKPA
ncbi:hypothetical protein HPB48_025612 [Haemaphysalis longicornis]|uniref:Myb-like domain-containing protein n=1 Tax=Haemaphysalis longicornis TaxID=44386 RepID=A0A9J6H9W0_HAELO|nr:hypothetical protein HPB48_025612 [Haemaphysalis longicornis]